MALTAEKPRNYDLNVPQVADEIPVAAATTIYEGAALTIDANGDAVNLTGTSGFAGFARETVVNSGAAGAKTVKVWAKGALEFNLTTDTMAKTDRGGTIEMSDNDTFRLAAAITGCPVGKIGRVVTTGAGGKGILLFAADAYRDL